MKDPRITVIIPTLNRAQTLHAALRTVVMQDYEPLTIIVSDNCSDDDTRDVIHAFDDNRIVYVQPSQRLSMARHWEFALSHVSSGWVTILGDDDGLLPGAVATVAEIAAQEDASFIASSACKYLWPGYKNNEFGRIVAEPPMPGMQRIPARWPCAALLDKQDFASQLPMLYTGKFVDVRLVEAMRSKHGRFFHSQIPDIFSGVLFSAMLDEYVRLNFPLGLGGRSRFSYGAAFSRCYQGSKDPDLQERKKDFLSEDSIPIHPNIPQDRGGGMPSLIPVFIYESILQLVDIGELPAEYRNHALLLRKVLSQAEAEQDLAMRERMLAWAHDFASLHGLQLPDSSNGNTRDGHGWLGGMMRYLQRKLISRRKKWRLYGTPELPLQDVHAASIAMGQAIKQAT